MVNDGPGAEKPVFQRIGKHRDGLIIPDIKTGKDPADIIERYRFYIGVVFYVIIIIPGDKTILERREESDENQNQKKYRRNIYFASIHTVYFRIKAANKRSAQYYLCLFMAFKISGLCLSDAHLCVLLKKPLSLANIISF